MKWKHYAAGLFAVCAFTFLSTFLTSPRVIADPPDVVKQQQEEMKANQQLIDEFRKELALIKAQQPAPLPAAQPPAAVKPPAPAAPQPMGPPAAPKAKKAAKGGIDLKTGLPFPRGLTPTPKHILAAAPRFVQTGAFVPTQYAVVPSKLSYWLNNTYGCCVTTDEAFKCACNGIFISDDVLYAWANAHDALDGANLQPIIQAMQKKGFSQDGNLYNDGADSVVDYSNQAALRAAIAQAPVKLGLDANALPQGAGNKQGWYDFGGTPGEFNNEDHCTGLSGFGTAKFCFDSLHLPLPSGIDPNKPDCYVFFTWSTMGVVDHPWIMSTVGECWARNPSTIIVGTGIPTPDPALDPVDPPTPPDPPNPPTPGKVTIELTAEQVASIQAQVGGSSLTEAEKIQFLALVAKVTGGGPAPVPRPAPPAGFIADARLPSKLAGVLKANDQGDLASAMSADGETHPVMMRIIHRKMLKDPAGQKLLQTYNAKALPPGWLMQWANWLLTNLPAILKILLPLFGFACVFPGGFGRTARVHREWQDRLAV